jgi:hypothetical protein
MAHRQLLTGDEHQALLGIPLGPDGWRGASPCPVPIKTSWRSDAETPTASALPFSSLYFITQASRLRSWSSPESYFRPHRTLIPAKRLAPEWRGCRGRLTAKSRTDPASP